MAFQGMRSSNDQLQNSWPSKLFLTSQEKRFDCSFVKYDASCIWLFSAERKVSQTVSLFLGCFAATPISWFCTDQLQTTQSLLRALWEDKERSAGNGEINSLLHQVTSLSQIPLSFIFHILSFTYPLSFFRKGLLEMEISIRYFTFEHPSFHNPPYVLYLSFHLFSFTFYLHLLSFI